MSVQELGQKIFPIAFSLFAKNGFDKISLEEVASEAAVPVEEIEKVFPNKEYLIIATGTWKMESISREVDLVVEQDVPIFEKLVKYLEVMYINLDEATHNVVAGMFRWQDRLEGTMQTYLRNAVYDRFSKIVDELAKQDLLKNGLTAAEALYQYWEMLSSILAVSPTNQMPLEINPDKKVNEIVCGEMIRVYKEVLNPTAFDKLEVCLKRHKNLSRVYA